MEGRTLKEIVHEECKEMEPGIKNAPGEAARAAGFDSYDKAIDEYNKYKLAEKEEQVH